MRLIARKLVVLTWNSFTALKNKDFSTTLVTFIVIGFIYTSLFLVANQLQGPYWGDEKSFYETSQDFSQHLIPGIEQIRNYDQLNTPLIFILFGQIERLFHAGVFGGRLFSFLLSIIISVLTIHFSERKSYTALFVLVGLFLYPYFLWFSTRYYTDIPATFLSFLGLIFYLKRAHFLSTLFFLLGIASRQYLLIFPLAIACHELVCAVRARRIPSLSFFFPVFAALSILGWFLIFGGLAPNDSFEVRNVPPVQRSLLDVDPKNGFYALANLGLFYVIPEWLLFRRSSNWSLHFSWFRAILISWILALSIFFSVPEFGKGIMWQLFQLPIIELQPGILFSSLVLIASLRFFFISFGLTSWLVFYHTLIMMKAFAWDKYTLPLLVALWFLRAWSSTPSHSTSSR